MQRNKLFIGFLLSAFLFTTNVGIFAPQPARADFWSDAGNFVGGVGQVVGDIGKGVGDFIGGVGQVAGNIGKGIGDTLQAISQVKVPGTDIILDLTKGVSGIQKQLLASLPDEVPIPGTDFKLYTKESPATNVIKNIAPMLSGVMGSIDPLKPIASLARTVIQIAKPYLDQYVKPYLPDWLKGGAQGAKDFIKNAFKAIDNPIVRNVVLPVWDFFVGPLDDLAMDVVNLLAEEQHLAPPGGGSDGGEKMVGAIGRAGEPLPLPPPPVPQDAVGSFDGIDAEGYAHGWAADPDTPEQSVGLEYVIDGAHESFDYTSKENSTASAPSPAGASAFPGAHGFRVAIPNKWRDGKPHTVVVKAYDTATGAGVWSNIITLPGSPRTFTLSRSGMGSLDSLSDAGLLTGWAYDADVNGSAEVEIYFDGKRGAGGTLLGVAQANVPRPDLSAELFARERIPTNTIGYTFQVNKAAISGGRHEVFAFVKDVNSTTGAVQYIELSASRVFYIPIVHALHFAEDPYVVVQGRWVAQEVIGLPSDYHLLSAYLDGAVIDLNQQEKSMYPWMYVNQTYKIISGPKNGSASATLQFKIPLDFPLGDHVVQLKTSDAAYHAYGSDHFTLRVVAPTDMEAQAAETLTPGTDTDIILSNIPRLVSIKNGGNATVTQVYLAAPIPGYEASGYEPYRTMLQNFRVTDLGNRSVKITALVPLEANALRKDTGLIRLYVIVNAGTKASQDEFRISYPYDIRTRAHTAAGGDPTLHLTCGSSLQPTISAAEIGYTHGLNVTGAGFGCRKKLTATISGLTLGKPFSLPAVLLNDDGGATLWDGSASGQILFGSDWESKYGDVETLTLEVKDADGLTAPATVTLNVGMRVLPAEGKTEILFGDWFRVVLKKVDRGGRRVAIFIDNNEVKRTYIETVPGESSVTIDARLLDNTKPGEHVLTIKTLAQDGRTVEEIGASSTRFIVNAQKKQEEKKKEESLSTPPAADLGGQALVKPKPVLTPKVLVSPTTTKPDTRVTVTATGYNPLGTMTIILKGQGRTAKLSGYADYTDSSGDLTKEVRLPDDLKGGEYTIEATDIQGLTARALLTLDVPPPSSPAPALPTLPVETPTSPSPSVGATPTPLPTEDTNKTPTCPSGSTYSPTLQQCLENTPTKLSPYDGLPCPANVDSIPSYATKGCLP